MSLSKAICPLCGEPKVAIDFVMANQIGDVTFVDPAMGGLQFVEPPAFFGCAQCYDESDIALADAKRRAERLAKECERVMAELAEVAERVAARRAREGQGSGE